MTQEILYRNMKAATLQSNASGHDNGYGLIDDAVIVTIDGRIEWVGTPNELPSDYADAQSVDLGGRLVTPALIDCHTHIVFGGNRAREFEMRLGGASYEEVARAGGGIISTVKATRAASKEELIASALGRLDDLIASGAAVIEVKSGYGLTIEDEITMLEVARHLEVIRPVKICTSWLAAHALPPEYADNADAYIDEVVIPGLRKAASLGLVDAVDGFCENIGFNLAQIERLFIAAKELGLPIKLHAEQLSDQKGALLAAQYGALSADHLEYLTDEDVAIFAKSGAVATLLPGAYYTLRETKLPPMDALRRHNVDMAIATDCNPGSSPISSLLTIMNMACIEFSMTPQEALLGVTRHAAKALGISNDYGEIAAGMNSNMAVWNVGHPSELSYWVGGSPLHQHIS